MKKIEAIIRPYKLEEIKEALTEIGVQGITISEVKGFGRQKGFDENFGIVDPRRVEFTPKIKLEMVLPDSQVEPVSHAIVKVARTGKVGDGKIFVLPIEEAFGIRTGVCGENAV